MSRSSLVASGNTYNPSLIVLRQKGYDLWLEKAEDGSLWCARKGDQSFLAYSGPELLLHGHRQRPVRQSESSPVSRYFEQMVPIVFAVSALGRARRRIDCPLSE